MSASLYIPHDDPREFWLDDIWRELHDAITYAEAGQLHSKVNDIRGIRRALERARVHFQLAKEAVKKIEEIDAAKKLEAA